jgi:hypothetical protein
VRVFLHGRMLCGVWADCCYCRPSGMGACAGFDLDSGFLAAAEQALDAQLAALKPLELNAVLYTLAMWRSRPPEAALLSYELRLVELCKSRLRPPGAVLCGSVWALCK